MDTIFFYRNESVAKTFLAQIASTYMHATVAKNIDSFHAFILPYKAVRHTNIHAILYCFDTVGNFALVNFLELISFLADPTYGSECCKSNYAIIDDYARATSMEAAITQYDRLLA